jgi:hypothetical protein
MKIGIPFTRPDAKHRDGAAGAVRIGFVAAQSLEARSIGRHIVLRRIEKSEHMIERSVFEHQHDNMVNREKQVGHPLCLADYLAQRNRKARIVAYGGPQYNPAAG